MEMTLGLISYIESAHKVGEGKVHGHNFRVETLVKGEYDGGQMDFHNLKKITTDVIKELDHIYLNDLIEVPVVENIARYLVKKLKNKIPLKSIKVWETNDRFCELIV